MAADHAELLRAAEEILDEYEHDRGEGHAIANTPETQRAVKLARHYVAQHDETPIDEAWLAEIGGPPRQFGNEPRFDFGDATLYRDFETKEWVLLFRGYEAKMPKKFNTRGSVLRLLEALGITTTAEGGEGR